MSKLPRLEKQTIYTSGEHLPISSEDLKAFHVRTRRTLSTPRELSSCFPANTPVLVVLTLLLASTAFLAFSDLSVPRSMISTIDAILPAPAVSVDASCSQLSPLSPPPRSALDANYRKLKTLDPAYRAGSAERLAQAVRIETVSFDDMKEQVPFESDPRRQGFLKIKNHFEVTYPLVFSRLRYPELMTPPPLPRLHLNISHKHLRREVVNVFGLLFTLEGTNPTLKPIILMAHTDTVPVAEETVSEWAHPPFSGFIDAERVWGRGSVDCKNSLTAQLDAVELILEAGFAPARTIILAYGFDEEISGHAGAKTLADTIYARYGHNGAELVLDEGSGRSSRLGIPMSLVGVQEKGYTDIKITVSAPGGHSSIPPPHTAIGILAEIVAAIESKPYTPALLDSNPYVETLRCGARWNPSFDPWLKSALQRIDLFRDEIVKELFENIETKFLITTSQAVDIIQGGTKGSCLK
ncbi:hypothetical protein BDK51DRAFT_51734 [Blyttiomyces helicus]|uniref:Uncharacterized protein n=1 Tax=Blyttiomyces helicus TaxID=388810 RepID=A0A4P9WP17_9FUNG|nr:hypothetical protein BDK51DRAFT_51734 [Blyttiomyces helicus]|eukprot:RKO93853.1 hypothetical protein BDK51DRAFT_51734 [Blyttiomyces helicus]